MTATRSAEELDNRARLDSRARVERLNIASLRRVVEPDVDIIGELTKPQVLPMNCCRSRASASISRPPGAPVWPAKNWRRLCVSASSSKPYSCRASPTGLRSATR
jgi:hypothetical protein